MHEWQDCFIILLLSAMAGSQSANGQFLKQGCIGESIKIKENISYTFTGMYISIYKSEGGTMGMWHINGSIPLKTNGYSNRVVLDGNGNIWITDLVQSDSDTYSIRTDMGNLKPNIEKVKLKVLVPPTKNCTPKITRKNNILITDLSNMNNKECGDPPVEAYWLDLPDTSNTEKVIEIQPGNDNKTFHACIKGDSLTCGKMSKATEYCSIYIDSTSTFLETSPESSPTATDTFSPETIVILILSLATTVLAVLVSLMCLIFVKMKMTKRKKDKEMKPVNAEAGTGNLNQTKKPEEAISLIAEDYIGSPNQRKEPDIYTPDVDVPSAAGVGETTECNSSETAYFDAMTNQTVDDASGSSVYSGNSVGVVPPMLRNGVTNFSRSSKMGRPKSSQKYVVIRENI